MKKYEYEGQLFCILYKESDWVKGLNFITSDEDYIQAGSWWYDAGKILDKV